MSHPIIGQGDHLVYQISQKNINLVEYVVILLPIKFNWILLCGFRGEFKNVLANQRPWRPSCFSDLPEKHKLGGGHWDLASCQVSLNSVQRFKRRSQKCLSKLEAGAAILFFWSAWKTLGRGCWDLASCQVSLNPVQQFQRRKNTNLEEIKHWGWHLASCISQSETRTNCHYHLAFLMDPKNTKLGRGY